MRYLIIIGIAGFAGVFVGCQGSADGEGGKVDTAAVDTTDTSGVDSTLFMDDSGYVDEDLETENIIEAKYGEQWDFCDCVVKNDSVNKASMEEDADIDAIFERMEVIDQHCKGMLATPNTTPEERTKHERKVNKCLRDAK